MNNNIDKEQVRRRFAKHLSAYDSLAVVQQQIAAALAGLFAPHAPARFENAMELGCGTGFFTRELLKAFEIRKLYLNDLVPQALPALSVRIESEGCRTRIEPLPGDAESMALPEAVELLASASMLQWFEDLPGFFARTARTLEPGGWLVFNLFGPENLHQIRTLTGRGLDYPSTDEIRQWLETGFRIVELREETIRQAFDTPFDVLRHLQQTGVTATGEFRWTPGSLRAFEHEYTTRYGVNGKVTLDWDVVYVIARKPPF